MSDIEITNEHPKVVDLDPPREVQIDETVIPDITGCTYRWGDKDQTFLIRTDSEGKTTGIPIAPGNRDYDMFVRSRETPSAFTE